MRKSRNKKWRHVYPYVCKGCGKKRIAFDHDRAAAGYCTKCQPVTPDSNQPGLFNTNFDGHIHAETNETSA